MTQCGWSVGGKNAPVLLARKMIQCRWSVGHNNVWPVIGRKYCLGVAGHWEVKMSQHYWSVGSTCKMPQNCQWEIKIKREKEAGTLT